MKSYTKKSTIIKNYGSDFQRQLERDFSGKGDYYAINIKTREIYYNNRYITALKNLYTEKEINQ